MSAKKYLLLSLIIIFACVFSFFLAEPVFGLTEVGVTPQGPATSPPGMDFFAYIKFLYPFGLSAAAILAVAMLVIAGVEMMIPVEARRTAAKEKIWSALGGLLLAVLSYIILRTINPQLINLQLNPPSTSPISPNNINSSNNSSGFTDKNTLSNQINSDPMQQATNQNIIKNNPGFQGIISNTRNLSPKQFQADAQQTCASQGGTGVVQNPANAAQYLCIKTP